MSSLSRNIASLFVVQFANYAIPIITLPWLTRILGPNGYGQMSLVVAVSAYFALFADYGFNLSATREIAIRRDDLLGQSNVFWNTLGVKVILAAIGLVVLFGALVILRASSSANLYLIGYLAVLGSVLTPTWYFQGTEQLALLSAISVAVRGLSVPAVFTLVKGRSDVPYAIAINSVTSLMVGIVCMVFLWRKRSVVFTGVRVGGLMDALRGGWHVFLSTASISLYSTTNAILVGAFAGNAAVGYFSAGEKLIKAVQGLMTPVSQSIYPRISHLMKHAQKDALRLIKDLAKVQGAVTLALSVALFIAAPFLVRLIYGARFSTTVDVIRWMAWMPFVVGLSNIFGVQTMLPFGMHKAFSRVLIFGGVFNLILLPTLARPFGATGAAMAVLATEIMVTALMGLYLYRNRSLIFAVAGERLT